MTTYINVGLTMHNNDKVNKPTTLDLQVLTIAYKSNSKYIR